MKEAQNRSNQQHETRSLPHLNGVHLVDEPWLYRSIPGMLQYALYLLFALRPLPTTALTTTACSCSIRHRQSSQADCFFSLKAFRRVSLKVDLRLQNGELLHLTLLACLDTDAHVHEEPLHHNQLRGGKHIDNNEEAHGGRTLAWFSSGVTKDDCKDTTLPSNWKVVDDVHDSAPYFYCAWFKNKVGGFLHSQHWGYWLAHLVRDFLTDDERSGIVDGCKNFSTDQGKAICAGKEIKALFRTKNASRPQKDQLMCTQHSTALEAVLEDLDIDASVTMRATKVKGEEDHAFVEAQVDGQDMILDCARGIYVLVK